MKKIKLSIRSVFLMALMVVGSWARGQKAYPVEIGSLLSKIPIPENSAACFGSCTTSTDPSNGAVSIKDNGPAFTNLNGELDRIMQAAISDFQNGNASRPAAPTADQIAQMQQQAMQRASQLQGMTPQQAAQMQHGNGTPPADNIALMKLIGQAQGSIREITRLHTELSQKVGALDKSGIDKVKMGPNCPDVQQGGYAGPTCACMIAKGKDYAQRRVSAENDYLQRVAALLREYIPRIRVQLAIVDDMETKAKFGEAVSNPVFRQQVVSVQREALSAIPAVLGISSSTWTGAANKYADEVNANSGSSEGCYNHKG